MARTKKNALVRRYIKLLVANPDPVLTQALLKAAPEEVIKSICNAAYNVTNGCVKLNKHQKALFRRYKQPITYIVQPNKSIIKKRRVLVQRGGGFFIPLLLSTVLPIVTKLLTRK